MKSKHKHHHRRHHHHRPVQDFFSNTSLDMAAYVIYPIFQIVRSIKVANGTSNIIMLIALDAIVLGLLWLKVLPTIYKRNREEQTDKSRSGIVLAVIAITLIIAIIKDYLIMTI